MSSPPGLPLGLQAWRLLTSALSPAARLLLRRRSARGKEDADRLHERLGMATAARPQGRLVWVHGASVGESLSALPLIEKLLEAPGLDARVLVTSGTVTSAAMMAERLPKGALHQFVPLDTPRAVAGFLDHWKPDAGLFVESDLWPNLILGAAARGVKLALVNARISARSAERWRWAKKSVAALLSAFDVVLAQDEEIAERFRMLGAPNIEVVGSLKADAPPLPVDEAALAQMRQAIGSRPVLLAAQTHPGEDETVLPAHDMLRARFPDLLTILVPRHTDPRPRPGNAVRHAAPSAPLQRRADQPADRRLYRRHDGRDGPVLSSRALLFSRRHAGAAGRAQCAGARGAALRGAGWPAHRQRAARL